jgi:hypothetical protein
MGTSTSVPPRVEWAAAAAPAGLSSVSATNVGAAVKAATLTVFFEGTANPINRCVTQIGLFASLVNGKDLKLDPTYTAANHQYKMSFDGCAVVNGNMGLVFATGLVDQCNIVGDQVVKILASPGYDSLNLNLVGLSRGGVAAIYLAQMLGVYSLNVVKMNLLLFDPVPGNLILPSRFLDLFSFSTANSSMDLSKCQNLRKVLAIYPYLPLPDLAFHAPVFPLYPSSADVTEDAVLGCHQGALFCQATRETLLSFVRIKQWLTGCGTQLFNNDAMKDFDRTDNECKDMMDEEMTFIVSEMVRHTHSYPAGTLILRNKHGSALYLNKWHETLSSVESGGTSIQSRPVTIPASEEGSTHLYLLEIKKILSEESGPSLHCISL